MRQTPANFRLIAFLALAALTIYGCALPLETSYESRLAYVDSNDLSDEVEKAILAGRVISGMSKKDVEATWGWASETDTTEVYGMKGEYGKEYWYYRSLTGLSEEAEVYFNNGKVYSVSPTYMSDVPDD